MTRKRATVTLLAITAAVAPWHLAAVLPEEKKDPYADHVARTEPRTPAEEQKGFHLPEGFEIQLVAAEPDIAKPLNLAFDDRGRLWVTETVEYPFPAKEGVKPRDRLKVLEDFAEDGRARKVHTFADGLNIPIGVLPLPGSQGSGVRSQESLVFSIPNIYRLADTTGAGKADRREVLYGTYGFGDTHGLTSAFTLGFDGWVYACHGYANTSTVKAADGSAVTMQSGNTYRFKADGSHVEPFTFGQVNPFGLALDPLGNLFSCDCHSRPVYQLLRGAWYPSFGKPHDGLGFGPEMMTHDHGSTAIAGLAYYAADHFPPAYRDTVFVGNVVTCRINHDKLERHGSTLKAIQQPDFLTSDDPWFRPVDIKLGPDGALYVADFYNRVIGHYEVPLTHPGRDRERGRIWRIVYRGKDGTNQPKAPRADWNAATAAELVQDLGHPNLTVRLLATHQLAGRPDKAVEEKVRKVMGPKSSAWQRLHGLWVLERRGVLDDKTLTTACQDGDAAVRVHAQRVLAERREWPPALRELAVAGLKDADAFVQRAAADALGRHPSAANLRPLLDLRHAVPAADTHLLHVVRMALRDQLRPAETWAEVASGKWSDKDLAALADVALGVPSEEAAQFLLQQMQRRPDDRKDRARHVYHVARHGTGEATRSLLTFARADRPLDLDHQAALLKAVVQGTQDRGAKPGDEVRTWGGGLVRKLLDDREGKRVVAGAELAGSLKLDALKEPLRALAGTRERPEPQRTAALNALLAIDPDGAVPVLGRVLGEAAEPVGLREQAAQMLARLNSAAAQEQLVQALPAVPARLQGVIAVGLAGSPAGAEKLLAAVAAGKASARLLQERPVALRLEQAKVPDLKERLAKLTQGLPPADQAVQELLKRRRDGYAKARPDPAAGAQVFEKHCAACHQIGGKGAKIAPQLDGIGVRGLDRLLEDTLDPNRNVDQAFRTTALTLKSGQLVSGLLLREEGEVLVLADNQGKEVRVPKASVEEKSTSQVSPMPANFAEQIPEAEFYHLLAFLLEQKPPK